MPLDEELLRLDILLRRKQVFWETPRALLLIIATTAGLVGAGAGFIGFRLGAQPQSIIVHLDQPLRIQTDRP